MNFEDIWDGIPLTAKYWVVICTILLLILGVFVLALEPSGEINL